MNIGEKINIKVRRTDYSEIESTEAEVIHLCKNFCVLSYKGLFRFCAFYGDIARGEAIII